MTDLELAVQLLGGSNNKVMYDDIGMPSIMVKFAKGNISDVITGGSDNTHAAFSVNGVEKDCFWMSKYQNVIIKNRAYSLPMQDPKVVINFDNSRIACETKGNGWHLCTNAEWAWIALQCRKNGFLPRGNNSCGKDHSRPDEKGIPTYIDGNANVCRVATGSGPKSWAHNNDASGVWDLNGNVYEWVGGYRTEEGEIQIIPYNNAADRGNSQAPTSTLWKAIMPDGSLVSPGSEGTLKWDYVDGTPSSGTSSYQFRLNTVLANAVDNDSAYGGISFANLAAASGVQVPEMLKALALMPADSGSHGNDYFYMRNRGERLAFRGGSWGSASGAGVFSLYGVFARSATGAGVGFRSAFVEL